MGFEIFIFALILALVIAGAIAGAMAARKRRNELAALAARLGLEFDPEQDRELTGRFPFLARLQQGSNRYAFNRLRGTYGGHEVLVFDYHYETHSHDSKGNRQTHHHYFSFFMLFLPQEFPELTIVREGWGSKLAQAFGYDDIDFESAEFSRKFCVRSKDKRFAYDICHARFMEYLLANDDLALEIEGKVLAIGFNRRLAPGVIEHNLGRLGALRDLFPAYLLHPA
jgi:hypothetical protein